MLDNKLTLKLLKDKYSVCRLDKNNEIPKWIFDEEIFSITKTEDELSIVCLQDKISNDIICEKDWKILKIEGPLDFSLVGILSKISTLMANNKISIFAISTYDTDYILIKEESVDKAIKVLESNSYSIFYQ
ncbi:ACT domain-containing protein [Clostridium sartagoforme]|uniref:ACT domain-containing protein n=1 Tax=Clostridium sartagoforme TaxID=84031 RepID=A0A4S2DRB6_9CLOT|nr:ACT domain-containing protein [Clostridium sartagoforme]TGY43714.1 ACT domain-containing protein [Clostridium sartagoforme]